MTKELNHEEKTLLIDSLEIMGIEYEHELGSQFFRDQFPIGIPADIAIAAIKEKNEGNETLEISALLMLAMVPVHGIETELLNRLEKYRAIFPQTKETIYERFVLSEALRYLNDPEGLKEFDQEPPA
jgi:CRISPR/Cas system-associated endonuclease Cas3-HD